MNVYLATSYIHIYKLPPPSSPVVLSESIPDSATRIFYFIFSKSGKEGTEGSGKSVGHRSDVMWSALHGSVMATGAAGLYARHGCLEMIVSMNFQHSSTKKNKWQESESSGGWHIVQNLGQCLRYSQTWRTRLHHFFPLRLVSKTVFILICLLFSSYLFFFFPSIFISSSVLFLYSFFNLFFLSFIFLFLFLPSFSDKDGGRV